jgi:DNA-binding transcriptional regulator YhcF (GntR family)/AcrR family transcriptional regulator
VARDRAARYGEIVAELRRQIDAGELAPGDRLPSTRAITRQWGVAMATATKALAELQHLGLARAVTGVGTVVAPPRPPAQASQARPAPRARRVAAPVPAAAPAPARARGGADRPLSIDQIVAAAIAIADAEGMTAVSMRRLATELGAAPMSLYRHVSDKQDLLLRMLDAVYAQYSFPATPPVGWRERLELAARLLWGMGRRHPWLALAMSLTRPQATPHALPFTEWVLTALDSHGLDQWTIFTVHLTLLNYVRGTAINVELEAEAEAASGLDSEQWTEANEHQLQELLRTGRFPLLGRLAADGYDFDLDRLFEFGLQRLLDGIAVVVEGGPPASG